MVARDGPGGAPPADSIDAEIAGQSRRVAELTRGARLSRHEAVHRVRADDNAELVKSNAAAETPARAPPSEPAKTVTRSEEQGPTQQPSRPKAAQRSYSYEHGSMASHQTDAVRQNQARQRFRAKQQAARHGSERNASERQGAESEKAKTPQPASPEKATPSQNSSPENDANRKTAPGPSKDQSQRYRELMKASQARQHSRGPTGPGQSRE
jgi:hypothetical protein